LVLGASAHGSALWRRAAPKLALVANARDLEDDAGALASARATTAYSVGCLVAATLWPGAKARASTGGGGGNGGVPHEAASLALDLLAELARGGSLDDGHVSSVVRAAALQGWQALASTALGGRASAVRLRGGAGLLPTVVALLADNEGQHPPTAELRLEAGLAAVVLAEAVVEARAGAAESGEADTAACGEAEAWPAVQASLARLATESHKRLAKDAKREQHAYFRKLAAAANALLHPAGGEGAADDGDCGGAAASSGGPDCWPSATLPFPGGCVACGSWREVAKLALLRRCLAGDVGSHLRAKHVVATLMADSRDADDEDDEDFDGFGAGGGGSGYDERGKSSEAGRKKTAKRGKERDQKVMAKGAFFDE
jgi:hypothetical protein